MIRKDRTQYAIEDYLKEARYPYHLGPETYVYITMEDTVRVIDKYDRTTVPTDEYESVGYVTRFLFLP